MGASAAVMRGNVLTVYRFSFMDRKVCGTAYSIVFGLLPTDTCDPARSENPTISGYISFRVGIPTNRTNRSQTVPQTVRSMWENPQTVQTVQNGGVCLKIIPNVNGLYGLWVFPHGSIGLWNGL